MYKGKSFMVLIPARGRSLSFPGKNTCLLNNKPLLSYAITAAKKSVFVDRVIVSTEDDFIARVASLYGAEIPFMRPIELAADHASSLDVIIHAIKTMEAKGEVWDYTIFIQPTTPLLLAQDIDRCIELHVNLAPDTTISVCESPAKVEWMFKQCETEDLSANKYGLIQPFLGVKNGLNLDRQLITPKYIPNGAIYINSRNTLFIQKTIFGEKIIGYVMPPERSIDIDTEIDLKIAETVLCYSERNDRGGSFYV